MPNCCKKGEGVRELFEVGKAVITGKTGKILSRRPKIIKDMLKKHGTKIIVKIQISKKPISQMIQKLANKITSAKAVMKERGYDALFHLYSNFHLSDGTIVGIDKQARLSVRDNGYPLNPKSFISLVPPTGWTLNRLFDEAEKKVGASTLYTYRAHSTNCQKYISDLMSTMGLLDKKTRDFIMQFTDGILSSNQGKIAKTITSIAALADFVIKGGGAKGGAKKTRKVNPWLTHVKEFRKKNPTKSYKQSMILAKKTYKR